MGFALDPRLEADTLPVVDWPVATLRLMDDARFPWLVLVPRVAGARELHGLADVVRDAFWAEILRAAAALERATGAHKMNVAALGNLVPQLHVHVIARFDGDAAWPGPVWGVPGREAWTPAARDDLLGRFAAALDEGA